MSHTIIHVHGATAIRISPIRRTPEGNVWRDVTVETAEGSFRITAFPEDKSDSLEPIIDSEEQREAG